MRLKKATNGIVVLLLAFSLVPSALAQISPINVSFSTALPMPIGRTTTVVVSVTDTSNSTVQLNFVGVRFEWSSPNTFLIGANSEKGALLAAGQRITYPILVQLPSNVTPGIHKIIAYVSYRVRRGGTWTGVFAGFWVLPAPFAYPSTQSTSQTTAATQQQATTQQQAQQPFNPSNLETAAILLAIVAIGLFLARGRVKRLLRKPKPKPGEAEVGEQGT